MTSTMQSISGKPPPAASMAVGQFFNPEEGQKEFSPLKLFSSSYSQKDIFLKEYHHIAFNLSFGISLGLLPVTLSLKTAHCGIKDSGLPVEEAGLCKLRCFPPVAFAWDVREDFMLFQIFTLRQLLWIPHQRFGVQLNSLIKPLYCFWWTLCSYKSSMTISFAAAASRFYFCIVPSQVLSVRWLINGD
ncbi:hypothetical protein NL676_004990 [Syzygium grande]|nr:hypothetical protein NL676_004990 [Syzygium grande]